MKLCDDMNKQCPLCEELKTISAFKEEISDLKEEISDLKVKIWDLEHRLLASVAGGAA